MPETDFGDMPLGNDPVFGDSERVQIQHASGQLVVVRTGIALAADREFVAQIPGVAWCLWQDGRVINRVWKQPGQPLPHRSTLQPPPPPPGAQDVWQQSVYWRLADLAGGLEYTFIGSASAIKPLGIYDRAAKAKRDRYSNVWPVVTISLKDVKRPGFNLYYVPVVSILGYVFEDGSPLVEEGAR
jgi:hypothetical protein